MDDSRVPTPKGGDTKEFKVGFGVFSVFPGLSGGDDELSFSAA